MIGIVAGLFCALIVAGLSTVFFNLDAQWYAGLAKPPYVVTGSWFEVLVSLSYISSVLSVSRLVEFKHLFPSMLFFMALGVSVILFCFSLFTAKSLLGAFICMTVAAAMSYTLFFRFLTKDVKIAALFFPTFLFNCYAYMVTIAMFIMN